MLRYLGERSNKPAADPGQSEVCHQEIAELVTAFMPSGSRISGRSRRLGTRRTILRVPVACQILVVQCCALTCVTRGGTGVDLSNEERSYLDDWEPIGGLQVGRHYGHAPITQAILEFQLVPAGDVPLSTYEEIAFGEGFGEPQAIFRTTAEINIRDGAGEPTTSTRQEAAGFMYPRGDGKRMVQAMPTHFTYVLHAPYSTWENFIQEAEAAWLKYKSVVMPQRVQSIGARFVNLIPLPEHSIDIRDYLRISVDIPAALPQGVRNLFTQVDIPIEKYDATCTITTSIADPDPERPGGALLLDIDARSSVEIDTSGDKFDETIHGKLDALRMVKNLAFEACITDATRERIK